MTVDKPYKAVSNGVLRNVIDLGAKRRFVWEQAQPMASYLALLDIARYQLDQRQASNGVTIRTYRPPTRHATPCRRSTGHRP